MDKGASILAKLKNKAREKEISYQHCLQLFFQEEYLRRLAKSPYLENLVLKGGLFIYTLTGFESRATVDIDFLLRNEDSSLMHINQIIAEIIATETGNNDTVILEAGKSERITPHRQYQGVSTQIIGRIKNVRVPFNIDIGVGDVIVPNGVKRQVKTQLDGYDMPAVMTYSLESTIAEKLDAILQRYELTGRMKDFYDIYYLAQTFDFSGTILQKAIAETLQIRQTPHNEGSFDRLIDLKNDADMKVKWRYFLRTIGDDGLPFDQVIDKINQFLSPVYHANLSGSVWQNTWDSKKQNWQQ